MGAPPLPNPIRTARARVTEAQRQGEASPHARREPSASDEAHDVTELAQIGGEQGAYPARDRSTERSPTHSAGGGPTMTKRADDARRSTWRNRAKSDHVAASAAKHTVRKQVPGTRR
jgi:hypothetical protein